MDLITPSLGLIFWSSIIFSLLLLVLTKFAWKPILSAVKTREQAIEDALSRAEKAKADIVALKAENNQILKETTAQRDAILKEGYELKEKIITEAKSQAEQEAKSIMEKALHSIENEKKRAISEIKTQVGILSIEMAEKILKKELNNKAAHKEVIDKMVAQL